MKVGILGGTFDPIHNGHVSLALSMQKAKGLDEVWFVVAGTNPLKQKMDSVSAHHRIAMVERAIETYPGFKCVTVECEREGPSYTIDTLKQLQSSYPENQYFLIMGADVVSHFMQWKDPLDILEIAEPLVGMRDRKEQLELFQLPDSLAKIIEKGIVKIPIKEISSTNIRDCIRKELNIEDLVPKKVIDYISKFGLYS